MGDSVQFSPRSQYLLPHLEPFLRVIPYDRCKVRIKTEEVPIDGIRSHDEFQEEYDHSVSALRYQNLARKSSLQVTKAGPVGEWLMHRTTLL